MAGANLNEPILSRNRQLKQKYFTRKETENTYTAQERRPLSKSVVSE